MFDNQKKKKRTTVGGWKKERSWVSFCYALTVLQQAEAPYELNFRGNFYFFLSNVT